VKCADVLSVLEDYQDGELGKRRAGQVESHLLSCPSCARALALLKAEDDLYMQYAARLERDLQVSPEIWAKVRAGIGEMERAGRRSPVPSGRILGILSSLWPASPVARQVVIAAAVAIVSVAATLIAVRFYGGADKGRGDVRGVAQMVPDTQGGDQTSLESAMRSIQRAEQEYLQAIRILNEIVEKQKSSLDPGLLAELEQNLKIIDQNIAATRAAYYAHPSDPDLAHYMLSAYSRKVELLQDLAS
jgi:hypothetical protein